MIAAAVCEGPSSGVQLLAPLRIRDFRRLWTGMALSLVGDGVMLVALVWQVYTLSNRPAAMALVGIALTAPQIALVLIGGVISDRFDRGRVMIVADTVRGCALALLAALSVSGVLVLWHVVAVAAFYGAAAGFFMPAFDALVPALVPDHRLAEANALDQFIRPTALWILGPAIGGALIGVAGVAWAFAFDAGTFAISVACLARLSRVPKVTGTPMTVRAAACELREGFDYVRRRTWLWATFAAATLTYLLFLGPTEVLLPYLIKNDLGGDVHDLAIVLAGGGGGALIAALVLGQTGLPRRVTTFTYGVWALATLAVAGYGFAYTRWHAVGAAAVVGGFEAAGAVAWVTTRQRSVPAHLRGRISSFEWFISVALVPVSYAVTAPVAAAVGIRQTLVGAGVLGSLVTFGFLFIPGVRDPERCAGLIEKGRMPESNLLVKLQGK